MFDASDYSIIETIELDIVLDPSDFEMDSLADD